MAFKQSQHCLEEVGVRHIVGGAEVNIGAESLAQASVERGDCALDFGYVKSGECGSLKRDHVFYRLHACGSRRRRR